MTSPLASASTLPCSDETIRARPSNGTYVDAFDYMSVDAARKAMAEWDGNGDAPDGWVRNFTTERRRPDGDPAREYRRA